MEIRIGSLFSGIGGFELGLERAIPNSRTIWQVEKDKVCRSILAKHWPNAKRHNEIKLVGKHNLENVDIICGGFPCQNISRAGKKEGIHGAQSSFWFEMLRVIRELRPKVIIIENSANIIRLGGAAVIGGLAEIGYDAEWTVLSAREQGSCHKRDRWFCVAYPTEEDVQEQPLYPIGMETERRPSRGNHEDDGSQSPNYWQRHTHPSPFCRVDDGVSNRMDRLKALGNSIVPQCSEFVGKCIVESGLLDQ